MRLALFDLDHTLLDGDSDQLDLGSGPRQRGRELVVADHRADLGLGDPEPVGDQHRARHQHHRDPGEQLLMAPVLAAPVALKRAGLGRESLTRSGVRAS